MTILSCDLLYISLFIDNFITRTDHYYRDKELPVLQPALFGATTDLYERGLNFGDYWDSD